MDFRKKLLTVVTITLAGLGLGACGSSSNNSSSGNIKGQNIKVGVWIGSDKEKKGMNDLVKGFEKKTGAKVTLKVYTDFNTQIQADLAGHKAPDSWMIDSSMYPFFKKQEVLQPLSEKVANKVDFYPALARAFTSNGKLYAAPKDTSTLALYVNKKMLNKTGTSISEIPSSYEGLVKWLPGFQKKLNKVYGKDKVHGFCYDQDLARNLYVMERNGGQPIKKNGMANLASSTVVKNLDIYKKLVDTGAAVTAKEIGQGDNGTAFGAQKVAMVAEGNWTYSVQKDQYKTDFAVLPMRTFEGKCGGMVFTVGWGEYAETQHKAATDAWIKYVTSKEAMEKYVKTATTLPSRPDVAKADGLDKIPALRVHLDANGYSTVWQDGVTAATVNSSYQNFINKGLHGKVSLESAMKSADDQANATIEKSK